MMPWREQLRRLWFPVRFSIWMPGEPAWANVVMKIAQTVGVIGVLAGSGWIVAAGIVLGVLVSFATP